MRTPGLKRWRAAMRRKLRQRGVTSSALSRRSFIAFGAAAAAAACNRIMPATRRDTRRRPVIIVGGGMAGLTTALRLKQRGLASEIFESSNRLGGRMFTLRNFTPEGQFCELGGELFDTGHTSLRALAVELGVGIERLAPEDRAAYDTYVIDGVLRTGRDMFDPETGTGAFLPFAEAIADHQSRLLDEAGNWTAFARAMDATSLRDYFGTLSSLGEPWVLKVLELAYVGQFGLPLAEQSSLNLIDSIAADIGEAFEIFGESDEAYRIAGGSSSLAEAAIAALGGDYPIHRNHTLISVRRTGNRLILGFDKGGAVLEVDADHAVLTLPFTRLRRVSGLDTLGLSSEKLAAINTLGYGRNAKVMVATAARPVDLLPGPASGTMYTDTGPQTVWDTSRGQPGTGGVLTNFLGGEAADADEADAVARLTGGLERAMPSLAKALIPDIRASFFWGRHPHTLASYSAPAIGQYTTLAEFTGTPELGGRLHFAGEHTSQVSMGYMDGAVESAERVATEIIAAYLTDAAR